MFRTSGVARKKCLLWREEKKSMLEYTLRNEVGIIVYVVIVEIHNI